MKLTEKDRQLLLHRDEATFEKIYYEYKNLVFFVVFNILRNEQDTDEIVQDTFVKMLDELEKFDGRYFKSWLLTIARNLAINRYHQNERKLLLMDDAVDSLKDDYINYRDLLMDIESVLSKDEYQIVILHNVYHLKHKEIAIYLNKPLGTVCWQYNVAINKLTKAFKKEE